MTDRAVNVWPEQPVVSGDTCTVAARIEGLPRCPERLWYHLPAEYQAALTSWADPFVIALIFPAMRHGLPLRVHGTASPTLLCGLEEYQAAWSCWRADHYSPVQVEADQEREEPMAASPAALMGFSGGLDSCFTAWRHCRGEAGRRRQNLQAALMVHGFDIPLEETQTFASAAENSRQIVNSIGLELIALVTNAREFGGGNWELTHGAALASCLHLFRARFNSGLIAGTHTFNTLRFPWGSNPLTDRLLGASGFRLEYDGAEFSRRDKARAIAQWPEATERLRVCWQGDQLDRNCGQCVRCVATALAFAVEGAPVPPSLAIDSLERAVRKLRQQPLNPVVRVRLGELFEAASAAGIRQPWVDELARCAKSRRRLSLAKVSRRLRRAANQLGRMLAPRTS